MNIHDLNAIVDKKKKRNRKGRGDSSGSGNFSGRGMNGQNSRSGGGVRVGFEGGQTPLLRRLPKLKGFKNPNRVESLPVNFAQLEEHYSDGEVVSPVTLLEKRIIRNLNAPIKILGSGELTKKLTFEGVKMSLAAEKRV